MMRKGIIAKFATAVAVTGLALFVPMQASASPIATASTAAQTVAAQTVHPAWTGPVDLNEWCGFIGLGYAVNIDGTAYGWRCYNGNYYDIDIVSACRYEYGDPNAWATYTNYYDPNSWYCYG
jgi:hypothetical protein